MPQQLAVNVENNFTKGLVTEFTGLNFPENAATDTDNCTYGLVGDVTRRLGVNLETNFTSNAIDRTGLAVNTYIWTNVGGDGNTKLLVSQVGGTVYFYSVTAATLTDPLSDQKLASTVDISSFVASGGSFRNTVACEFTNGNGYLFIFHPDCDPVYCTYAAGVVTGTIISVQTRDFIGIVEGTADNFRPPTLSDSHKYNLYNQGWGEQPGWSATSTSSVTIVGTGNATWTIQTGLTIAVNDVVSVSGSTNVPPGFSLTATGLVVSYNTGTGGITINLTSINNSGGGIGRVLNNWSFIHAGVSYINTFQTAASLYPSNAEQWWRYKNSSGVYAPATTLNNITLGTAAAPKGHYIYSAFNKNMNVASGLTTLTTISTTARPTNGTWFQGRVWYTGVSGSFAASGTAPYTTWTENIYFSQIVNTANDFGKCYQVNDPTSEELFDILSTDGGVIVIQGSGTIYRLFPIQNGLIVFAANGVWFITGSQGIGFSATDYTITKLSAVKSISTTSYVDVQGLPYFWNEEGVYAVMPQQGGGLAVQTQTYQTIDTYYSEIPLSSKQYARGDYDPINYTIKWIFKSAEATDVTTRYSFDKILNYNTANKAFYPYTISNSPSSICSINYISGPGGSTTPPASFKHLASYVSSGNKLSFADEHDATYTDWASTSTPSNYISYIVTGYRLRGKAINKFQVQYLQVYARTNGEGLKYKVQGIWDYANTGDTGRWTTMQVASSSSTDYDVIFKRHKIRGNGYSVQFKFTSSTGEPFDLIGWSAVDTVNQGT